MDKRKTGIALFITLMVIASIMSIIAVSFSYLEKAQKDAGSASALIQANILYGDVSNILKKFFPAGSDNSDKLTLIYTMPLFLNEEKSGFAVNLSCKALMTAVPINWLHLDESPQAQEKTTLAKDVFTYIVDFYEVEEPLRLEEIILNAITGEPLKEEEYEPRLTVKKGIISEEQFNKVLTNYAFKYDDTKVLDIPWDKYFTFIKVTPRTKIDGNYPSLEFIAAAFDIPIETVQSDWIIGESTLSSFLNESGISTPMNNKIYANKALNAMHCQQTFAYQERQYTFNFNYIEGRSSNFEFTGQE